MFLQLYLLLLVYRCILFPKIKKNYSETFGLNNKDMDANEISDFIQNELTKGQSIGSSDDVMTTKLKKLGKKANKPKYLKSDDLFNLFYAYSDGILDETSISVFTSKYMSKNYDIIFGEQYVKLDNNKYVDIKYLKNKENIKILKKDNYIYQNKYIEKSDKNIIDSRYIKIPLIEKLKDKKIIKIEIKPEFNTYKIIYSYESIKIKREQINYKTINPKDVISIDLGVTNLMTIYDPSGRQYVIKGGFINSVNSHYKKQIGKAQKYKNTKKYYELQKKRENVINNYFNKLVKWIYIKYKHKKLIIIGYNEGWKNECDMGKKMNGIFYSIPYKKLLNKIKMKLGTMTLVEESYTSKCDGLSLENICYHEKYMGERINRGMFKSGSKKLINADLNGAINIMRKLVPLKKVEGLQLMSPKKINIFREVFSQRIMHE